LNFNKELSCKSLGREFHAVGAEKPKLRLQNLFERTRGISSWPVVKDRREVVQRQAIVYEESGIWGPRNVDNRR